METDQRLAAEFLEIFQDQLKPFQAMMMQYECAMLEIQTKLEVLNKELSVHTNRNPFESIKSRIKKPMSILEKLNRNGLEPTLENLEGHLTDIAGIRVICSFPDDIYKLADYLVHQDDVTLIAKKDYIAHPKPNGYRSLHLILEVPIFLTNEKKNMKVEVQFRTIAMDFWASLEHKLKYKKTVVNRADAIADELKECAEMISTLDARMQNVRDRIDQIQEV